MMWAPYFAFTPAAKNYLPTVVGSALRATAKFLRRLEALPLIEATGNYIASPRGEDCSRENEKGSFAEVQQRPQGAKVRLPSIRPLGGDLGLK
jgi:hypothetical protein